MFVDSIIVTLMAGSGGNGAVAWRREKFVPKGGPSGGNGGDGGSIILEADPGIFSLESFRNKRLIRAKNGHMGGGNLRKGQSGANLVIKVPYGTLVKDATSGEVLFDFTAESNRFEICKGGRGGAGNAVFRSSTNQAPTFSTPGAPGETLKVELELKLIADVGLIGMPNAGKSTLMSQITSVKAKIGAYPFTTLSPNLSFIQNPDHTRTYVADIPGIIENAHVNKGLGLAFLRHVERTSMLIFVLDASGIEGRDPCHDFEVLQNELKAYKSTILEKPFLIALNKTDVEGSDLLVQQFRNHYPYLSDQIFAISALNHSGLTQLLEAIKLPFPVMIGE
ncbi:MAG TPA: GTPase ObgE [Rhabdochlamydiaceae bacterium]|nr:GTPase ObgE [Rhabdochlamydiaceae bacterium]